MYATYFQLHTYRKKNTVDREINREIDREIERERERKCVREK